MFSVAQARPEDRAKFIQNTYLHLGRRSLQCFDF
jgi:hypothetical protein